MNEKTKLRIAGQHEIGVKIDDRLEAAQKHLHALEGGNFALKEAAKKVEALAEIWSKQATDEALNELVAKGALAVSAEVKRWILRASGVCASMAEQAGGDFHLQRGRVEGMRMAIDICKSTIQQEQQKDRGDTPDEIRAAVLGPIADIEARRSEAKAEKAANGADA